MLLKHHLKALKLPTMLAEAEKIAQRCAADNADHLAFLLQLVELELIERERKAAERRLKAARFPATKILDEFDFAARPSVNKPQVLELVKGEYLDRRENILLVGTSGTGKTHLATAFGMAACSQGRKVRFFRVTELVTLLLGSVRGFHGQSHYCPVISRTISTGYDQCLARMRRFRPEVPVKAVFLK